MSTITQRIVQNLLPLPPAPSSPYTIDAANCSHCKVPLSRSTRSFCESCVNVMCSKCTRKFIVPILDSMDGNAQQCQSVHICHGCFHTAERKCYADPKNEREELRRKFYREKHRDDGMVRIIVDPIDLNTSDGELEDAASLKSMNSSGNSFGKSKFFMSTGSKDLMRTLVKSGNSKRCFGCGNRVLLPGIRKIRCTICLEGFCKSCISKVTAWMSFNKNQKCDPISICDECRFEIIGGAGLVSDEKSLSIGPIIRDREKFIHQGMLEHFLVKSRRNSVTHNYDSRKKSLTNLSSISDEIQFSSGNVDLLYPVDRTEVIESSRSPIRSFYDEKENEISMVARDCKEVDEDIDEEIPPPPMDPEHEDYELSHGPPTMIATPADGKSLSRITNPSDFKLRRVGSYATEESFIPSPPPNEEVDDLEPVTPVEDYGESNVEHEDFSRSESYITTEYQNHKDSPQICSNNLQVLAETIKPDDVVILLPTMESIQEISETEIRNAEAELELTQGHKSQKYSEQSQLEKSSDIALAATSTLHNVKQEKRAHKTRYFTAQKGFVNLS